MAQSDRREDDELDPLELDALELEPPDFSGGSGDPGEPGDSGVHEPAKQETVSPNTSGDELESYDLAEPAPAAPLPPKPRMKQGAAPAPPAKAVPGGVCRRCIWRLHSALHLYVFT